MESKLHNNNNISGDINLDEIISQDPKTFYTNIIYDYKVGDLVYYKRKLAKILYIYHKNCPECTQLCEIEIIENNHIITVYMSDLFPNTELTFELFPDKSDKNTYNLLYLLTGSEKLYSTVLGPCTIKKLDYKNNTITFVSDYDTNNTITTLSDGTMFTGGECVIFPSKQCRDWEVFVNQLKYPRLSKGWTYYSIESLSKPVHENKENYTNIDTENYINGNYFYERKEAEFFKLKCIELLKSRQN